MSHQISLNTLYRMLEVKQNSAFMMQGTMMIWITERIVMAKKKSSKNLTSTMKSPFQANTKNMKKTPIKGNTSQTVIILARNMTNIMQNMRTNSTISMIQSMTFSRKNSEAKRIFIVTTTRRTMLITQKTSKLKNSTNKMTSSTLKIVATKRVRNTSATK